MKKICTNCKEEKSLEEFPKSYGKNKDGSPTGLGRRSNCRLCENARRKASYQSNIRTRLMMNVKARVRKYDIPFDLELSDIVIPDKCPLLEVEFIIGEGNDYAFTPTIDRIDPTKGYVKNNIRVISMLANRIKSNATKEQLLTFTKNISKYLSDDIV